MPAPLNNAGDKFEALLALRNAIFDDFVTQAEAAHGTNIRIENIELALPETDRRNLQLETKRQKVKFVQFRRVA